MKSLKLKHVTRHRKQYSRSKTSYNKSRKLQKRGGTNYIGPIERFYPDDKNIFQKVPNVIDLLTELKLAISKLLDKANSHSISADGKQESVNDTSSEISIEKDEMEGLINKFNKVIEELKKGQKVPSDHLNLTGEEGVLGGRNKRRRNRTRRIKRH